MTVTAVPVTLFFFFNLGHITVESEPGSCKWIKDSGWLKRGLTGGAATFPMLIVPANLSNLAGSCIRLSSLVLARSWRFHPASCQVLLTMAARRRWRKAAKMEEMAEGDVHSSSYSALSARGASGSRSVITFLHKLLSSSANQFHRLFIVCVRERARSIKTSLFATLITCIQPTCTIVDTKLR